MNGAVDPTLVFSASGVPIWFYVYALYRRRGKLGEFRTPGLVMAVALAVSTVSSMVLSISDGATEKWVAALALAIFWVFAASATRRW